SVQAVRETPRSGGVMKMKPRLPRLVRLRFWAGVRDGLLVADAARAAGVSPTIGFVWFREAGGVAPALPSPGPAVYRRLSFAEREDIAIWSAQKVGVREIARRLGRSPGTVSKELARNGGAARVPYRASTANHRAEDRARRPKPARLATNLRLRREVQAGLEENRSPEQIAGRLRLDFPDEPEMRVSHESIYQALYVQGRGALRRDLAVHLRTGRAIRRPQRRPQERRGRIKDMVNISERPPEVADRAVPGHWEGDLIMGSTASNSAIGTLVERATGFVMLLHLPQGYHALAVQEAMCTAMAQLPDTLRRTLTWDQGREMANHVAIADATGLDIYFCDPHSPWQRGSNENTNGLLRQYFPKGSDLSFHGPGILANVANELNRRPRKRHGWANPAEVLDKLLSEHDNPGVSFTA
ncbi:IS30 family transposase, partial [Knoellia sp. CPCC 206435]|uniref:IS30 family transposase n=1 Tax=Knoellia terrae TaxID=3404797 RepID=UPI003B432201